MGYNFISFSLFALYGYSFKFKFTKPGQKKKMNPKDLTLLNIIKKGTKHGVNSQFIKRFLYRRCILEACTCWSKMCFPLRYFTNCHKSKVRFILLLSDMTLFIRKLCFLPKWENLDFHKSWLGRSGKSWKARDWLWRRAMDSKLRHWNTWRIQRNGTRQKKRQSRAWKILYDWFMNCWWVILIE